MLCSLVASQKQFFRQVPNCQKRSKKGANGAKRGQRPLIAKKSLKVAKPISVGLVSITTRVIPPRSCLLLARISCKYLVTMFLPVPLCAYEEVLSTHISTPHEGCPWCGHARTHREVREGLDDVELVQSHQPRGSCVHQPCQSWSHGRPSQWG